MSITTNAIVAFGISLYMDQEIPWEAGADTAGTAVNVEDWWLKVNGYEPPFKVVDERGNGLDGVQVPQRKKDAYWKHYWAALKANPLPVKIVLHCTRDCPMYIVAVPGTVTEAYRHYPRAITLLRPDPKAIRRVTDFCERFGLKGEGPDWWLASLLLVS